jgi:hypothetical protein
MQRFYVALVAYAVVALAAWFTLSDLRIRGVTVIVLAGFALRTWAHGQRERREAEASASRESSIGPM